MLPEHTLHDSNIRALPANVPDEGHDYIKPSIDARHCGHLCHSRPHRKHRGHFGHGHESYMGGRGQSRVKHHFADARLPQDSRVSILALNRPLCGLQVLQLYQLLLLLLPYQLLLLMLLPPLLLLLLLLLLLQEASCQQ